jgi:hypothetical protein
MSIRPQRPPEELGTQCLIGNAATAASSSRHCPASEAVGSLTMRYSEPGGSVAVAIMASRAPVS